MIRGPLSLALVGSLLSQILAYSAAKTILAASTSLTATVSMREPVGRVVSCGLAAFGSALAVGAGCGSRRRLRGALNGCDQGLADGQLGGFLVGLVLQAALVQGDEDAHVVAGSQPAADDAVRLKLEGDFLQACRDLHRPWVFRSSGATRRSATSCSPGTRSTAATLPLDPSRDLSEEPVTAAAGSCSVASGGSHGFHRRAGGNRRLDHQDATGSRFLTARWSAPWA